MQCVRALHTVPEEKSMVRFFHAMCLAAASTLAAAQSSAPAGQCTEEFVQDYLLDDSVTYASITPCPDADLNATPAWPLRRDEIHKEYSRDDFYTRLVQHDWHVDVEHARPNCVPVSRRVTRVYWKKEGGEEESARVAGSTIERSSQTGEKYGSLIKHGGAQARTPRGPDARYETTRFGIDCLRIDSRTPGVPPSMGSLCMPILPTAKCRAELYLMPIEATVPVGDKQITGRTTRLDLGTTQARVDRSSWVMP
jgi:hypothetical protein